MARAPLLRITGVRSPFHVPTQASTCERRSENASMALDIILFVVRRQEDPSMTSRIHMSSGAWTATRRRCFPTGWKIVGRRFADNDRSGGVAVSSLCRRARSDMARLGFGRCRAIPHAKSFRRRQSGLSASLSSILLKLYIYGYLKPGVGAVEPSRLWNAKPSATSRWMPGCR